MRYRIFYYLRKSIAESYENNITSVNVPGLQHACSVFIFKRCSKKIVNKTYWITELHDLETYRVWAKRFPASIAPDNKLIPYTERTIRLTLERLRSAMFC